MKPASLYKPEKTIVLVGLMGAGKTCVGKRLAKICQLPFADADDEIVKAAGCSIEDIFELYGEKEFRAGERKVIRRLLNNPPHVLATGGGAFMDGETREAIARRGISVWLSADLDTLVNRTRRRGGRPLLDNVDVRSTLAALMEERYPVYRQADIVVDTSGDLADRTAERVFDAIRNRLDKGLDEKTNQ